MLGNIWSCKIYCHQVESLDMVNSSAETCELTTWRVEEDFSVPFCCLSTSVGRIWLLSRQLAAYLGCRSHSEILHFMITFYDVPFQYFGSFSLFYIKY